MIEKIKTSTQFKNFENLRIGAAPMGVHADGGLEKSIFLIFKSSQKKIGAEFGGFGPGKRFLRRFGSLWTKNRP